jgi:corrinoid protein of di/trimethylamine methyltransferase
MEMKEVSEIIEQLKKAILEGDKETAERVSNEVVELGVDPLVVVETSVLEAVNIVGERFEKGIAFLTELVMTGNAAQASVNILKDEIKRLGKTIKSRGKVVIGTVQGDIHDIGKTIVASLLIANGFEVYDLGIDVPPEDFIDEIRKVNADVVGLSALVSTTLKGQKDTIEAIEKAGLRDKVKIIVGGAPVTEEWAKNIGADAWTTDATEGIKKIKDLVQR